MQVDNASLVMQTGCIELQRGSVALGMISILHTLATGLHHGLMKHVKDKFSVGLHNVFKQLFVNIEHR